MKKSSFVAMVLGTAGGVLFALGMCMALLPEWNAFTPGIIMGGAGLLLGLITVFVWRRMEGKKPIRITRKTVLAISLGVSGALLLGWGMCLCMVWNQLIAGIVIGLVGIIVLLCLIPFCKGWKE